MVINAKNPIKMPIIDMMLLGHGQSNYWATYSVPLGERKRGKKEDRMKER